MSPSSEALKSGNFFSVATAALIMKASMLTLTPLFSFSLFNCTRKASRSVMSASSWLVTCGIITQLRCRFAPEIFLIRDSGLLRSAPNLVKSTFGHGSRLDAAHAAACRCCGGRGFAAARRALGRSVDVFLQDAALVAAALHPTEIHAQFARELAHAGTRVGERRTRPRRWRPAGASGAYGSSLRARRLPPQRRRAGAASHVGRSDRAAPGRQRQHHRAFRTPCRRP